MERTIELVKVNDKSVVLWEHKSGYKQYVVCSYYDGEKPIGAQWCWGHYFTDLFAAVDYIRETEHKEV